MKYTIKKGLTSVSTYLFIQDSSSTTGAGKTGLAYNTASLVAYYVRPLGSATSITLATQTVTGAYSSGGFVEVDATNMPGVYRFDIPDAVVASGVNSAVVMLKGASGMAPIVMEIQLVAYDPQDSVRLGLTALPNAAAEAAGGLYTRGSGAGQINQPANGQIDANTVKVAGTSQTAGDLASMITAVDDYVDTEVAAIKAKTDNLPSDPADASDIASSFSTVNSTLSTIASYIDTEVAAIKAKTDNLPASPAATGDIPSAASVADAVWDEAQSGHTTTGTFGKYLDTEVSGVSGGGGSAPTASQIADAVWDEKVDEHMADRSFGTKIGLYLPVVAPDIDYKRIKKVVNEEIRSIPAPIVKEPDLIPISEGLQALLMEIRGIDIPKPEKTSLEPVLKQLEASVKDIKQAIKDKETPVTDLTEIQDHLYEQDELFEMKIEDSKKALDSLLERVKGFFGGDMESMKKIVEGLKQKFDEIPYVVIDKKKESPKKESVLDEYLKL